MILCLQFMLLVKNDMNHKKGINKLLENCNIHR